MASVRQNRFGKLLGSKAFVGPKVGKIGGGESYLAEQLTVKATVENEYGESVSATCTTNFTVVAVDVEINGVGEDKEETTGAFVQYVADTNGLITVEGTNRMVLVAFSCKPSLPANEMVKISFSGKGELYEKLPSGELVKISGEAAYPACEVGKHKFLLHGHEVSSSLRDGKITKISGTVPGVPLTPMVGKVALLPLRPVLRVFQPPLYGCFRYWEFRSLGGFVGNLNKNNYLNSAIDYSTAEEKFLSYYTSLTLPNHFFRYGRKDEDIPVNFPIQ